MGICHSAQVTTPNGKQISSEEIENARNILNNFCISKEIVSMFNELCFTQSQAKDLAKALINGLIHLEKPEGAEDKQIIERLFDENSIKMIKDGNLLYYGLLDSLKMSKVNQTIKSRVYHMIANILKNESIESKLQNQYGIYCVKSNDYNKLTESEVEQVVKYETIAGKISEMGQKIGFMFESIKKQSQKMLGLLEECMSKHIETINQMNFDLTQSEVMKMAQISRQACDFYDNGVFVLLVYYVQSCNRLQNQLKTPEEIQNLLRKAIGDISVKYPPGQGLSREHQELIKTLRELENPKNYNKAEFNHQQIKLTSATKQLQVQQIITKYAKIAEQAKESFEELVKATCLTKCVYFKTGLKYNASKPNIKALTRIKEKMFFQKSFQNQKKASGANIKEVLQKEQTAYRSIIDEILKSTDIVRFKITDMVRGKCVFLQIADIIYSVNQIKKFVAKNPNFAIQQIESRFTNKLPISDVTLKIILNNKIVAQLQLTIQTNAATYSFAHKIYELQRSKVFSKLKIVHNYFQESREDFNELAKKALGLHANKSTIAPPIIKAISEYFKLDSKYKALTTTLQQVIYQNKGQLKKVVIAVDPNLQDLITVAFNIALGRWGKDIGSIINRSLKNQLLSPKLKSTVLSIFLEALSLPRESEYMQQLGLIEALLKQKIYLKEYMREYFGIDNIMQYSKQNHRVFSRIKQLEQVVFYKQFQAASIQLKDISFFHNPVIEQHSFKKIERLGELFNFYFATRKEDNSIYELFSSYSRWIQQQLSSHHNSEAQVLKNSIEIVKAQYLIEKNQPKQAKIHLQNSLQVFKSQEEYAQVMKCQILLAECFIKTNSHSIYEYRDMYDKKIIQKAQILGLRLKGPDYADSLWRISQYLQQKMQTQEDKKQLLRSFTAKAMEEMSESKGKQFIYALNKKWKQYNRNNLKQPLIKENTNITYVLLRSIGAEGCENLARVDWKNLSILYLPGNNIGAAGCQFISKASWRNLTSLYLSANNIGVGGCQHLSKAEWKNLITLDLPFNNIGAAGCQYLSKGAWKNITILNLSFNSIGPKGCEYLSKAGWQNITSLSLPSNSIGALGCEHLSKAHWKNITTLNLHSNNIGGGGCQHLSNADWKQITILYLYNNNIGAGGCEHLSKADWKSLQTLYLQSNKIEAKGCEYLKGSSWKQINTLYLYDNNIGSIGCQHLIKADWKNLTTLALSNNNIGAEGCNYLSQSSWEILSTLSLQQNNIGAAGCQFLSKANWKNITTLHLHNNNIKDEGCAFLGRAEWKNLTTIYLQENNIGVEGCQHLSKIGWKHLRQITLRNNNITFDKETLRKLFTQDNLQIFI